MSNLILRLEDVGKLYKLGYVGTGTLREDISGWLAKVQGKANPNLPLGFEGSGDGTLFNWALRNIYLDIYQGEILGIIGANGSGKSTLLKLLSRVTAPTTGSIKMKGRVGSLLEVGTGFHPELTGRENIFLNGSILGMSNEEINRKYDEIVDFAGVERYIDTPVKRYSSGMYVRLGFAVAAHLDPDILIVDEVLSVGDAEFQKKAINKISSVAQEGMTILFVSHNMNSVRDMTTRCVELKDGEIVNEGQPEKVVEDYLQKLQDTRSDGGLDQYRYSKVGNASLARIEEVRVDSSNEAEGMPVINLGEKIKIALKINADKDIKMPFVAINIKNSQMSIVARIHTHEEKGLELKKGINTLECTIPDIMFYPGNYFVSVGLRAHISSTLHWDVIQDYPCFRIANIGEYSFHEVSQPAAVVSTQTSWKLIS